MEDSDSQPLLPPLREVFHYIRKQPAQARFLIHCSAGKSRSASIVLGLLMLERPHLSLATALAHLRKVRPQVSPNPGFLRQLLELEHHRKV